MADRFSFFESYYTATKSLSYEEKGEFMEAICEYAFYGKDHEFQTGDTRLLSTAYEIAKPIIAKSVKIIEGGSKGGRKGRKKRGLNKGAYEGGLTRGLVNEEEKEEEKEEEIEEEYTAPESAEVSASFRIEKDFENLWSAYPKRAGRATAFAAYCSAISDGIAPETIKEGLRNYKQHIQDNRIQDRYILSGGRWFEEHRWEDSYGPDIRHDEGEEPY